MIIDCICNEDISNYASSRSSTRENTVTQYSTAAIDHRPERPLSDNASSTFQVDCSSVTGSFDSGHDVDRRGHTTRDKKRLSDEKSDKSSKRTKAYDGHSDGYRTLVQQPYNRAGQQTIKNEVCEREETEDEDFFDLDAIESVC